MSRLHRLVSRLVVPTLALLVVGAAALGWSDVRSTSNRIAWRAEPRRLSTRANLPSALSDDQLAETLVALRPRFRAGQAKVNHIDHALRCWGIDASFDDGQSLSGVAMRQMLVDRRAFVEVFGPAEPPLMRSTGQGVLVRVQQGPASSSHVDHTLATLAEIGTPADYPVLLDDRQATVAELLDGALGTFSPNQPEYEWTILTYLLFAEDPSRPFLAADGQTVTLDLLAERLMRQTLDEGVCYGNHRLYTIAILERLDREAEASTGAAWLSPAMRGRLRDHLTYATFTLLKTQTPRGCWEVDGLTPSRMPDDELSPRTGRILMTGHALEFWAMCSRDFQPPREPVVRASQWLVREVDAISEDEIAENYTYLSHACRALCLWRGEEPAESWRRLGPLGR